MAVKLTPATVTKADGLVVQTVDSKEAAQIAALKQQVEEALARNTNLAITNQKTYDLAVDERVSLMSQLEFIDALFEPMRKRAYDALQAVYMTKRALRDPVEARLKSRNSSITEWDDAQEDLRKIKEQEVLAQNTAEAEKRRKRQIAGAKRKGNTALVEMLGEAPLDIQPVVVEDTYEKSDDISIRAKWEGEVTDFWKLVKFVAKNKHFLHLLEPSMTPINQLARSQKELLTIPGLKANKAKSVAKNSARSRN